MVDIATGIAAFGAVRATLGGLLKKKIDDEVRDQITDVLVKVGDMQDTMYGLREELAKKQDEVRELKQSQSSDDTWKDRLAEYVLVEAPGGGKVYEFKGDGTPHYACPKCVADKMIHILQRCNDWSGVFDCPKCDKTFQVNSRQPVPKRGRIQSDLVNVRRGL